MYSILNLPQLTSQAQKENRAIFNGIRLVSPIDAMVRDSEELRNTFSKFDFIPYTGTAEWTAHRTLSLLELLNKYSPSQGECVNWLKNACFGGSVMTVNRGDGFGELQLTEVQGALLSMFRDQGFTGGKIAEIAKGILQSRQESGNAWVVVEAREVGGVRDIDFKVYPQRYCTYFRESNEVIFTPYLGDLQFWKDVPPEIIPVHEKGLTLDDIQEVNGVKKIAFHHKISGYEHSYYALPPVINAIYAMFNEWQLWDARVKEADNHFIGRLLIMKESGLVTDLDASDIEGARDFAAIAEQHVTRETQKLNAAMTAGSDYASGVIVTSYPNGTASPTIKHIPSNDNHEFLQAMNEDAANSIYAANGLSKVLTGRSEVSGGIGADVFVNTLKAVSIQTVTPIQNEICSFLNKPFSVAGEWLGYDVTGEKLQFSSPYKTLMDDAIE